MCWCYLHAGLSRHGDRRTEQTKNPRLDLANLVHDETWSVLAGAVSRQHTPYSVPAKHTADVTVVTRHQAYMPVNRELGHGMIT